MTCIVGLTHKGKVYIGGDSAGVSGLSLTHRADKKVFKNGNFLMGFTTSFRMGQILQYSFNPPPHHPDDDVFRYMVTDFVDGVRYSLKDGGFASIHSGNESGGCFMVGYAGRLFTIDSDYQVGETLDGYFAIGCGSDYALGAMFACDKYSPHNRITNALNAANHFSAGVSGPFHIEYI